MATENETRTPDALRQFVLDRLDEDERRYAGGELPWLDEAERRGRLRILRTDDGTGLLLTGGPVEALTDRAPIPFPERAAMLREEIRERADEDTVRLLASAYDQHVGWQEEWKTTGT